MGCAGVELDGFDWGAAFRGGIAPRRAAMLAVAWLKTADPVRLLKPRTADHAFRNGSVAATARSTCGADVDFIRDASRSE